MPAVQTTYSNYMAPYTLGQIFDVTPQTIVTREVQTATGMLFGAVAVQGTGDKQVKTVADAGLGANALFVGVAIMNPVLTPLVYPQGNVNTYGFEDLASLMVHGAIIVTAQAQVNAGQGAAFDQATGGWVPAGTGSSILIPGARFESSGAAAALVRLRLL